MDISKHASARQQQRGIPALAIDLVMRFGCEEPAGGGAVKYSLNKEGWRRLQSYAGSIASRIAEHMDVFVVMSGDGKLITVGHRTERIRRR